MPIPCMIIQYSEREEKPWVISKFTLYHLKRLFPPLKIQGAISYICVHFESITGLNFWPCSVMEKTMGGLHSKWYTHTLPLKSRLISDTNVFSSIKRSFPRWLGFSYVWALVADSLVDFQYNLYKECFHSKLVNNTTKIPCFLKMHSGSN